MSVAAVAPLAGPILDFALQIAKWIDEGLDDEEIQKRMADPSGVGADMLKRVRERREIGERLLGRAPRP